MQIQKAKISDLISPEWNPRQITPEELEKLENSLNEFGYIEPIIVNDVNNHIVGGNQRYKALQQLGYDEVDVVYVHIEDLNKEKACNVALNKISGDWDHDKLQVVLEEIELSPIDIKLTGFEELELKELNIERESNDAELNYDPLGTLKDKYSDEKDTGEVGSLKRDFIMPPFSILRGFDGDWLDLKSSLKKEIGDNGESRQNVLYGGELGTSIFDPVLALIILTWFTPNTKNIKICDCFGGDSAVGYLSSKKGYTFTAIELRQEQVDLNNNRTNDNATYICDDGRNILNHIPIDSQDLFFSCPPYFNMEIYSNLENDASNQKTYEDFIDIIDEAFSNSIKTLKKDRFAVIVASDVRDQKTGYYYPFLSDIKNIFEKNGMGLYNEIILADPLTTAGIRARKIFRTRKVVKVHQNILVFYKGDIKKIKENYMLECESGLSETN